MLKCDTINRGQAFVNIINIRRNFEKHARKLHVSIEPLHIAAKMQRKFVETRSGRKASSVSIVRKSRRQINSVKTSTGSAVENISVKDDSFTVTKVPKRAVNFVDTSLVLTGKRLIKPNLKYVDNSFKKDTPKRIPIYKKNLDESDTENIKNKRDIYKFTDGFVDKSDINIYDKETAKIMTRIEKAEKNKRKNTTKTNKRKKKTNNKPKNKNQPVTMDIELIFNTNNENIKTYAPKCLKPTTDVAPVQILADVVVHASLNSSEPKKTAKKHSVSAFDKLKSNQIKFPNENNRNLDEIHEIYAPEELTVRNTSPLSHTIENTPHNNSVSLQNRICYTKPINVNYDRSNNFGFDDEEDISPEKRVLIHLNEAARKLQKNTPWRNRLIVKNKRILTVKANSLPNVDQELILDATMLSESIKTKSVVKKTVQTNLEGNKLADLSTLFDSGDLSPIKPTQHTLKTNLISTPFRRSILQTKNQTVIESEDLINPHPIAHTNSPTTIESNVLISSYFGFDKSNLKENVSTQISPSKMPLRIQSSELKRFKRKYVNKKQCFLKGGIFGGVEEKDLSGDELGIFDELLDDNPVLKKHRRRLDDDVIATNKKKRLKIETSEFNKWAKQFNKTCKEIDNHQLLIE